MKFAVSVSQDCQWDQAVLGILRELRGKIGSTPVDLVILFFSSHFIPRAEDVVRRLFEALSPQTILGCTGEGIIGDTEELEDTPAIVVWTACMPDVQLTPFHLSSDEHQPALIVGWPNLAPADLDRLAFILLADPFTTPMSEVLAGIEERWPRAPAVGGLAGGGRQVGENQMALNEQIYQRGLVGVALSGPLCVKTVLSQGCRPIGNRFVVTKATRNIIQELSGTSAMAQLEAVFKSLPTNEKRMAQQALHIGIAMDEQRNRFVRGDFLIRTVVGVDRQPGSLAIGDVIQEGQTVQFQVRDAVSASEDLRGLMASAQFDQAQPPLGALLFSCCGRGRGLFGRAHHDIETVRNQFGNIPIGGMLAQGEIGPVGGMNFLHGYTASVAFFAEPSTSSLGRIRPSPV